MKEIDLDAWNRKKQFTWFNSFSNPTYSINKEIDVTDLVNYVKKEKKSFFVCFLYILTKGLNSVPEMRIRYVKDKIIMYDDINPAYTVMTEAGTFENVCSKNNNNFHKFYDTVKHDVDEAKIQTKVKDTYNDSNLFDEYYITCLPWIDFTAITHPIPDDKESLSVPRICFGKYQLINGRYKMMLNITVSHAFVDGYPLSQVFINIEDYLNNLEKILG